MLLKFSLPAVTTVFLVFNVSAADSDRASVAYFDDLFSAKPPPCFVNDVQKTKAISEYASKCVIRKTVDGQQVIGGYKEGCSQVAVKAAIDKKMNVLCINTEVAFDKAVNAGSKKSASARVAFRFSDKQDNISVYLTAYCSGAAIESFDKKYKSDDFINIPTNAVTNAQLNSEALKFQKAVLGNGCNHTEFYDCGSKSAAGDCTYPGSKR